jgi:hypothetical protein
LIFPVTLSEAATSQVTVQYTLSGVTATGAAKAGPGVDFLDNGGVPKTLTFKKSPSTGETPIEEYVTVPVLGDTNSEGPETFTVTLSNVTGGYVPLRSQATGTILDDDPGSGLRVGAGDASVVEGQAGTRLVKVLVSVSGAPGTAAVSVPYTVSGVNATWGRTPVSGNDFGGPLSGTLTFTGNTVAQYVSIPIYGDTRVEGDETIHVTLGAVTGATVTRSQGTITIIDDDYYGP